MSDEPEKIAEVEGEIKDVRRFRKGRMGRIKG